MTLDEELKQIREDNEGKWMWADTKRLLEIIDELRKELKEALRIIEDNL